MSHAECLELLAVYRDLGAGERARVDAHLGACPACAARLLAYRRMDRDLAALADPRPPQRLDARFAAPAAQRRPRPALLRRAERVGNALAWAAVAVVAAALVAGLALAGRPLVERTWPATQPTAAPTPGVGRAIVRDELIVALPYQPPREGWQPDLAPQLSPDGARVAYFVPDNQPDGVNLLVVRELASGKDIWWGLANAGANAGLHSSARWSPGSRSLAFVLSWPREGGGVSSSLFRLDLERRHNLLGALWARVMRLFGRVEPEVVVRRLYGVDYVATSSAPAISVERWSADGRFIELAASAFTGNPPLRVRADGRGTQVIAQPLAAEFGVETQALRSHPTLAPTGDYWLAVVRTAGLAQPLAGAPADGDSLLRYDVGSRQTRALASCTGEIRPLDLSISPDGEWIVFLAEEGDAAPAQRSLEERISPESEWAVVPVEETGAWMVRRDGSGLRRAPGLAGGEFVWGAPGRIYLHVPPRQAGSGALYELDLASGLVGLVAGDWAEQALIAASRDGSRLLVSRTVAEEQETELRWLELAPRPQNEPTPAPQPTATPAPAITPVATSGSIRVGGWSPDSRWLAFWLAEEYFGGALLHFYDAHTGEMCDCPEPGMTGAWNPPLAWKDEGQVVVWHGETAWQGVPCRGPFEVVHEAPPGEAGALSPGGRYKATRVEEEPDRGRISVTLAFTDAVTGRPMQVVEYTYLVGEAGHGGGGEWVTDTLFLIHESLERGPLLVDLQNGRVIAVAPEFFGPQEMPRGEFGYWALAKAVAGSDTYHLLPGGGMELTAAYPPLRLYHSETGQVEDVGDWHPWFPPFSPDGRWLLLEGRAGTAVRHPWFALWVRPVDPPGSPAHLVAEGDYQARWTPDWSRMAMAGPGFAYGLPNVVSAYTFPEGRPLGSWATGEYAAHADAWSPDGKWLAMSGNVPAEGRSALFVVEP